MKIASIIPARGGSKGIPGKNIKPLMGKPLISYVISASLGSKYVNETYVSTEDEKIAKISKKFGAKIIKRPKKYATDTASSESVLLHFVKKVEVDILVFLQCTAPLTESKDINGAVKLFLSGKFDSVLSVCGNHGGFLCGGFLWTKDGKSVNYEYKERPRRQDLEKIYRENGAIYIMTKKGLLKHANRLYGRVGLYLMPQERSYEIDAKDDLRFLEKILLCMKDKC